MSFDDDDFEWSDDVPIKNRPVRIFGRRHPLGNPAEVRPFLEQGERWVAAGGPIDIADMDPSHALNAAGLIYENVDRVVLAIWAAEAEGPSGYFSVVTADDFLRVGDQITTSPLFSSLLQRAGAATEPRPSWR